MQEHQKTGVLSAEIPSGTASLNEPCHVEIKLQSGAIVSCSVVGKSGRRVTEKQAMRELAQLGRLSWVFTPLQERSTPPSPPPLPPPALQPFPRRLVQVELWQMGNWPRIHRKVFALVDGTRPAVKIAEMLSLPPDLVNGVLRDLQSIGVVTMNVSNTKLY